MRVSPRHCLGTLLVLGSTPSVSLATEVAAGPPSELSVTLYRAPGRSSGGLALESLDGFALITETRTVAIPEGESDIRFDGVADGIESASVLLSGLPADVLEKNRDAQLLSPSALVAASIGKRVVLVRTDPDSGRSTRTIGTLRSDAGDGVVFEGAEGVEALRCSGLPETFSFSPRTDLRATPALSVRVRSASAVTAAVTLSYLSRGFDWSADYVASLAADGASMDVGAWVTLANDNGAGFEAARTQIVAGRLNRESGQIEAISLGTPILAQCWPQGTTSDQPDGAVRDLLMEEAVLPMAAAPAAEFERKTAGMVALTAKLVEQEQLGDLKLYRVPERTTVSSRQMKQVRLLDRSSVPVQIRYVANLQADQTTPFFPAQRMLQTVNDAEHHLGLPLPSGEVALFEPVRDTRLLLNQARLRDIAIGEEIELDAGASVDVQVEQVHEKSSTDSARARELPWLPGVAHLRSTNVNDVTRIEVHNARGSSALMEIRLRIPDATQIVAADHAVSLRHDKPVFDLTLEAGQSATIRYRTAHSNVNIVPR
jgi:hypothetical protein